MNSTIEEENKEITKVMNLLEQALDKLRVIKKENYEDSEF